jgi:hypothetical protein
VKVSRHPVTDRYNSVFKMSNIVEKISGRERHVKLGIISVETMTRGRFRNDLTEWSSIEDKETRSKNRFEEPHTAVEKRKI